MANANKNLEHLAAHLEPGEIVQADVAGAYEVKIMGSESVRNGILVATDRRLLFFAKKLAGFDLESYPYGTISSMEQSKNMMGGHLKFFASGNTVSMKWIKDRKEALGEFVRVVQSHVNSPSTTSTAPTSAAPTPTGIADQIKELGGLRDQGLLTDEEFADKKAELLKRM